MARAGGGPLRRDEYIFYRNIGLIWPISINERWSRISKHLLKTTFVLIKSYPKGCVFEGEEQGVNFQSLKVIELKRERTQLQPRFDPAEKCILGH